MDHRDFGWSNFWICGKLKQPHSKVQLYLWATISRFSHTNEYVVKENNLPLSRRGMAPSAWVLRLSIGPSTPPSLEDLDTKCPYEFRPTVFKSSAHRIGLALQQERVESLAPSICFEKKTRLRAFDLWVTSATLGAQVYKAVVLEPTWPGITSSHYPVKVPKDEESK